MSLYLYEKHKNLLVQPTPSNQWTKLYIYYNAAGRAPLVPLGHLDIYSAKNDSNLLNDELQFESNNLFNILINRTKWHESADADSRNVGEGEGVT